MAIHKITDTSGSVNNKITRGGDLILDGIDIKVGVDHLDIGVYFINAANENDKVRVREKGVFVNEKNTVKVEVPFGLSLWDKWFLEIKTQYPDGNGPVLTIPRTIRFTERLRVRNRANKERMFGEDSGE
jgi:hypothetical protein